VGDVQAKIDELQAELDALRRQLKASESAHEIFRVLFEHSSDAHLIFDQTGIIDCNHAAIAMLACQDKAEVLRLHPAVLSPERQPDGRLSMEKSVEMDGLARIHGYHRFEWTHRRMNGELFPVEVTLTPVTLASGGALLVVWHELTEIKARENKLMAQLEVIREQKQEILRLSMPVIEVGEGLLMVPVLGALDEQALKGLIEPVLMAIGRRGASTLIIDLTGLRDAEGATALHLARLLAAIGLLGVQGIIVGLRAQTARAFVEAEAPLQGVPVYATMREALARTRQARRKTRRGRALAQR
jgi:PAS domain S-box-containing protein